MKWWEKVSKEDLEIFKNIVKQIQLKDDMESWMKEHWGERCSEYMEGCGLCEAWKSYDYLFQFFDEIVLGVETNEPKRNGKSIK